MKLNVGDRVRVVLNLAGAKYDELIGDTGRVTAILNSPNRITGLYPAVRYQSAGTGQTVVALEGELEKIG